MEKTKTPSTVKVSTPVTFPESYPFSLVASLPEPPQGLSYAQEENAAFYPSLGETAVVLLVLILSCPTKHLLSFLESSLEIEGRERFVSLLLQFFKVATSILDNDAFPKSWVNINVLAHKILIRIMDPITIILEKEFIPLEGSESEFDANLWRECLQMLLKLLSSEHLVIEEFSSQV
jgi:dedicator of cytokinesis protein 3